LNCVVGSDRVSARPSVLATSVLGRNVRGKPEAASTNESSSVLQIELSLYLLKMMSEVDAGGHAAAQRFVDLWKSGACNAEAHSQLEQILTDFPLSGRVIHGLPEDKNFSTHLSSDGWKKVSWVFGSDALPHFLGKSAREICLLLGFGAEWLDAKVKMGVTFTLALFPSVSVDAVLADWNHVLRTQYPPSITSKVEPHLPYIIATDISAIESEAGYSMMQVTLKGRDPKTGEPVDRRYMSMQRLAAIESPSVVQVRQFLWDEIGMGRLFHGDGQTKDDRGRPGPQEYFAKNYSLAEIIGAVVTALQI